MSIARKILMGSSGGKKSTYVDDVFSTYLYRGNNSTQTITNGVDLEGEGGLVWIKDRDQNYTHHSLSTQGVGNLNQFLYTSGNGGFVTAGNNVIDQYNSNGFNLNIGSGLVNANGIDYTSWSFRKAPGFFDVVTYTGNGSARTVAHSLGSAPGMIIIKRLDASSDWRVYHRNTRPDTPQETSLRLNTNDGMQNGQVYFNDTFPTSSVFTVGTDSTVNANGGSYVAYIFGGGESNAATAKSVKFDQNYIKSGSTSDYTMGTGDFTIECWYKPSELGNYGVFQLSSGADGLTNANYENTIAVANNGSVWMTYGANGVNSSSAMVPTIGTWYHLAFVKTAGKHKLYVNGIPVVSVNDTNNYSGTTVAIGGYFSTGYLARGDISNFRITKGQALYTSAFKPPTAPLTTTSQGATASNVKLICCNDTSVTGSTVTGATISVGSGSPTARTNSPFDDPEGYKFGEDEDQNLIKCGYYKTDSNTEDATINLGWEPQWILAKRIDSSTGGDWLLYDSLRGLSNAQDIQANSGSSKLLSPNLTSAESNTSRIGATSTGFYADQYGANRTFVYMAIRRPDGLVGKPPEAGTDVFTMDLGNSSATQMFTSGFPVDFATEKFYTTGSYNWGATSRLTAKSYLYLNTSATEASYAPFTFDQMDGWGASTGWDSTAISYMWKRHAGFDVVTYTGNSTPGRTVQHNLSKIPEMIWIKCRGSATEDWVVGHKGLNGGTNPWEYSLRLNGTQSQIDYPYFNDTAPTSTLFTLNNNGQVNGGQSNDYIAMLFASVDGISKVGYYDGSSYSQTITTGFQPRFVILKRIDSTGNWYVLDTTRGWGAGNDKHIQLNETNAQSDFDFGAPTATGFTLTVHNGYNGSGGKYIYYAHA